MCPKYLNSLITDMTLGTGEQRDSMMELRFWLISLPLCELEFHADVSFLLTKELPVSGKCTFQGSNGHCENLLLCLLT